MVKKKLSSKKIHESKNRIEIFPKERDYKKLRQKTKPFYNFEFNYAVGVILFIVFLLFVYAAFIGYLALNDSIDTSFSGKSNSVNVDIDSPKEITSNSYDVASSLEVKDVPQVSCKNLASSYKFACDSEQSESFSCSKINDNKLDTQWLAGYSCGSSRNPCVVNNKVQITANEGAEKFNRIKIYNRIEQPYYLNKIMLSYNSLPISVLYGSGEDTLIDSPWEIKLDEPTDDLEIKIVEIMGTGGRYLAGVSEIELFACE